jgi:hypothetical protein
MTGYQEDKQQRPIAIPIAQLIEMAGAVANEMKSGEITPALRERFIAVRTALFQRGIYDPVLVRFDSATAPRATKEEIAAQLELVAQSLA